MCPQNKCLDKLYMVSYICKGVEDFCFPVIGICCAGCLETWVLSPVIQKFEVFFYYLLNRISTYI